MDRQWIILKVPAKLNIYLQAGKVREDGYHDLTTVYQAITIYDELKISSQDSKLGLTMMISPDSYDSIPTDSRNLVIKAAQLLATRSGIKLGAHFDLMKAIPTEAGLGGGSADAAAALVGCNILWKLGLSESDLMEMGSEIGEDIPFLINGMMAVCVGHRSPLIDVKCGLYTWHWVLAIPEDGGLLTKDVFRKFDELKLDHVDEMEYNNRHTRCLQTEWGTVHPTLLAKNLINDLEPAASAILPGINLALSTGRTAGSLGSVMTGSGSTCAFLARDLKHSELLTSRLQATNLFKALVMATGPVEGVEVKASSTK